ncbi:unnamed protein product [Rhodiola kirilowii]
MNLGDLMEKKSGGDGDRAESWTKWSTEDAQNRPARCKSKPLSAAAFDSISRLPFSKRKAPALLSLCLGVVGKHFEDIMLDLGEIAVNFPADVKLAMGAIARRRKLLTDDVLISLIDASWEILDLCGSDVSDIGLIKVAETCKSLRAVDISRCGKATVVGVSALFQCCSSLVTLRCGGCLRSDNTMRRCLGLLKPQLTPVEEDTWEEIDVMEITHGAQSLRWLVWPTIDPESLESLSTECPRITVNPTPSTSLFREIRFPNEVSPDVALDDFVVQDIDPKTWSVWGHVPRAEPSPSSNPNELSIAEKFRLAFAERDARLAPKRAKNARQHLRRSAREWMKDTDAKAISEKPELQESKDDDIFVKNRIGSIAILGLGGRSSRRAFRMEGVGESSSSSSIVSKARTAFHSAAAKAERVFVDIKSDFKPRPDSDSQSPCDSEKQLEFASPDSLGESKGSDGTKQLRWRPPPIGTKQDWQDRFKNIRIGKKGSEESEKADKSAMSFFIYDENLCYTSPNADSANKDFDTAASSSENSIYPGTDKIPSSSVVKQLAVAIENGRNFRSMKGFLASSRDSSPGKERSSLSLSAMKSLVLRDKDDKFKSEFGDDEKKVVSLIQSLFDPDRPHQKRNISSCNEQDPSSSLPREIHGAPIDSFIIQISEIIGNFKALRHMALFWIQIVNELRRLWFEEQHIPGISLDEIPDLSYCLLYQQLQVINTCLSRKKRRVIATEALERMIKEASSGSETTASYESDVPSMCLEYARVASGELVLRLGADHPCDGVTMLETGEPVYSPITQEGPLLTEDVIRETEEFVLRTGSVGAGCSQLLSDMQAFKAANPGCLLEDFVRWHSPPDWTNTKQNDDPEDSYYEAESAKGQLSSRMQKEGNLWRELWETSKPVPAYKQAPLFDEDLAVEGILNHLEDLAPSALFEQLFVSLVGVGITLSESVLSSNFEMLKLFTECKEYTVATFQSHSWSEKLDDLCQVYETIETMLLNPEEVMKIMKQQEEAATTPGEQPKRRFRRLTMYFGKDKQSKKPPPSSKGQKAAEEPMSQSFSKFFDSKSSLFSRKSPKPESVPAFPRPADKPISSDDGDWTVV